MVYEEPKRYDKLFLFVLWAYPTSKHNSTQVTPFSLVYGAEAMVPIEVIVPSACLALAIKLLDPHDRICDIEALKERMYSTDNQWLSYHKRSINPIINV